MTDKEKIHELCEEKKKLSMLLQDEYARCNNLLRENMELKECNKTMQTVLRVYYPQYYDEVFGVNESLRILRKLLIDGWKVVLVTENEGYFSDYILEKKVSE